MKKSVVQMNDICAKKDGFKMSFASFSIEKGTIMGLVGRNGAGKTFLIKILLGLTSPNRGKVKLFGNKPPYKSHVYTNIGVVLDTNHFPKYFTLKNINSMFKHIYKGWDQEIFFNYLKIFRIPSNRKYESCSFGMKKKIALSVALAHKPSLLILDEITAGIDIVSRLEILNIFLDFMKEGNTILISSNNINDLEKITDSITLIDNGHLVFSEKKEALLSKYKICIIEKEDYQKFDKACIAGQISINSSMELLIDFESFLRYPSYKYRTPTIEEISLFLSTKRGDSV